MSITMPVKRNQNEYQAANLRRHIIETIHFALSARVFTRRILMRNSRRYVMRFGYQDNDGRTESDVNNEQNL